MFEITVEKSFSAAHALRLPDGTFEPVHGHDWRVAVTVAGEHLDGTECVMDFHVLEDAVEAILHPWRNQHLNGCDPFRGPSPAVLKVNPTAERVAWWIGQQLAGSLGDGVAVKQVAVGEAVGCTAVYRP